MRQWTERGYHNCFSYTFSVSFVCPEYTTEYTLSACCQLLWDQAASWVWKQNIIHQTPKDFLFSQSSEEFDFLFLFYFIYHVCFMQNRYLHEKSAEGGEKWQSCQLQYAIEASTFAHRSDAMSFAVAVSLGNHGTSWVGSILLFSTLNQAKSIGEYINYCEVISISICSQN